MDYRSHSIRCVSRQGNKESEKRSRLQVVDGRLARLVVVEQIILINSGMSLQRCNPSDVREFAVYLQQQNKIIVP